MVAIFRLSPRRSRSCAVCLQVSLLKSQARQKGPRVLIGCCSPWPALPWGMLGKMSFLQLSGEKKHSLCFTRFSAHNGCVNAKRWNNWKQPAVGWNLRWVSCWFSWMPHLSEGHLGSPHQCPLRWHKFKHFWVPSIQLKPEKLLRAYLCLIYIFLHSQEKSISHGWKSLSTSPFVLSYMEYIVRMFGI